MKVKEFLDYEERAKNLSPLTIRNYRRHIKSFVIYMQGAKDLDECNESDIVNFLISERERGMSAQSCNLILQSIRNYFDYLVRFHGFRSNPAVKVEKMKVEKTLPRYIPEHKMNELFAKHLVGDSFKMLRSRAILAFFYMTGARCAELGKLNDVDLDFVERRIFLFGKGRKHRVVPMCATLGNILQTYISKRDLVLPKHDESLFCTIQGIRLSDREIRVIVTKALSCVVSEKLAHPHILRHTFATVLMNHGKKIQDISRWLGHTSIAVTQRYLTICANPVVDNFDAVF